MSAPQYRPDDPRLTAHALGELDEAERAEVEQMLAASPEARAELAAIQQAAEELRAGLIAARAGSESDAATGAGSGEIRDAVTGELNRQAVASLETARPLSRHVVTLVAVATTVVAVVLVVMLLPPGSTVSRTVVSQDGSPAVEPMSQEEMTDDVATHGEIAQSHRWGQAGPGSGAADRFEGDLNFDEAETSRPRGRTTLNALRETGEQQFGRESRVPGGEVPSPSEITASNVAILDRQQRLASSARRDLGGQTSGVAPPKPAGPVADPTTPASRPAPVGQSVTFDSRPGEGKPAGNAGAPPRSGNRRAAEEPSVALATTASVGRNTKQPLPPVVTGTESRTAQSAVGSKEVVGGFVDGESKNEANVAGEQYQRIVENPFLRPQQAPLSTFGIDVDTASYSNIRRFLTHGQWPPADAVRIEEMINYFKYDYPQPADGEPFSVNLEVGACPWESSHRLVRVGLKGREIKKADRPPTNLVFLIDVSGSMADQNKLPLVRQGLELLVNELNENDRIAIVTYAGNAGLVLESTSGEYRAEILSAIRGMNPGGSTNGEAGIKLAYQQAVGNLLEEGTNRVILCTDGDFNVGVSNNGELVKLIEGKAKQSGVFLSILGFGMGNLKDARLEQLADKGNGHYAYIDSLREARKVFVEDLTGTLYTIAKDVKIQIEFNPAVVGAYRLVGYENRLLAAEDFHDDRKDAGEIGAGHTVTALYEIIPAGQIPKADGKVDPLKYQQPPAPVDEEEQKEMLTLKLRSKQPKADQSTLMEYTLTDTEQDRAKMPSRDFEWTAAVAGFGMILRNSEHRGQADFALVQELATGSRGDDASGRRREFLDLVLRASRMRADQQGKAPAAPQALPEKEARKKAAMNGRYTNLLRTVPVENDHRAWGAVHDYGFWEGTEWAGHESLPAGHWVYVYPNWYIWKDLAAAPSKTEVEEPKNEKE